MDKGTNFIGFDAADELLENIRETESKAGDIVLCTDCIYRLDNRECCGNAMKQGRTECMLYDKEEDEFECESCKIHIDEE